MESNLHNDDDRRHERGTDATHRAGEHDRPRLVHLNEASDLDVADGDPDIRGWDLRTLDGLKIGTVEDLVVDTNLMRVRYIEGEVMLDDSTQETKRRVLIPIDTARLDEEEDDVIISLSTADARALPTYDGELMPDGDVDGIYAFDDSSFFGARRLGRESSPYIASLADRDARRMDLPDERLL
ncbi:PRC-barrel domain-containing protein [Gemmatimonas sp.]|uniref:PRC-barrel domain-containing protein n=1 Tax=Gemmatimonas sp. TaxID=1962908 RepID=UPI003983C1E0